MRAHQSRRGRRVRRWLTTTALWLSLTGVAHAISVDNVISMHQSGLPADVIMQTLKSTNSSFSLTVDDLKKLEAAGVPKPVIEAMMSAARRGCQACSGAKRRGAMRPS